MKLDQRLNLVIPLERDDGSTLFVHSAPIARATFEAHYKVLAAAHAQIFHGLSGLRSSPRVAGLIIRDVAREMKREVATEQGLLAEIRRLTNVVIPTTDGNTILPLETAIARGTLDDDETSEVDGYTAFFTVMSAMESRKKCNTALEYMGMFWGTQTSSSNVTAFAASLRTSTAAESSGETAPTPPAAVSRIPY